MQHLFSYFTIFQNIKVKINTYSLSTISPGIGKVAGFIRLGLISERVFFGNVKQVSDCLMVLLGSKTNDQDMAKICQKDIKPHEIKSNLINFYGKKIYHIVKCRLINNSIYPP